MKLNKKELESTKMESDKNPGSERSFGIVFAIFFLVLSLIAMISGSNRSIFWLGISILFLLFGLFAPKTLKPLNYIWFKFGLLLHSIASPLIKMAMFYLVITPIGLIMRFLGKRPLNLLLDSNAPSYWIKREPPGPSKDSFIDQF